MDIQINSLQTVESVDFCLVGFHTLEFSEKLMDDKCFFVQLTLKDGDVLGELFVFPPQVFVLV